jgi:8-oxo-dGTP diphosphatase
MQHRISAGVIVEHDDRILVVRHVLPGRYDFWVAPGGGVQGSETLSAAAEREAREETGLNVEIGDLLYIEEFIQPGTRHCKFWFRARMVGGELTTAAQEAKAEYITEAAWLTREDIHLNP